MSIEIIDKDLVAANWESNDYIERLKSLNGLALNYIGQEYSDLVTTQTNNSVLLKYYQDAIYKSCSIELQKLEAYKSLLEINLNDIHRNTDLQIKAYTGDRLDDDRINGILDDAREKSNLYEEQLKLVEQEIGRRVELVKKEKALSSFLEKQINLKQSKPANIVDKVVLNRQKSAKSGEVAKQEKLISKLKTELDSLDKNYKTLLRDTKTSTENIFLKYETLSQEDKRNIKIRGSIMKEANLFLDKSQKEINDLEKIITAKIATLKKEENILLQKNLELSNKNSKKIQQEDKVKLASAYNLNKMLTPLNADMKRDPKATSEGSGLKTKNNIQRDKGKGRGI